MALAARVGARGTPAFFINGRFLSGAQPIENFKTIIDDEIGNGEGANLVVGRHYRAKVSDWGTATRPAPLRFPWPKPSAHTPSASRWPTGRSRPG